VESESGAVRGVVAGEDVSNEDFLEQLGVLNEEFEVLVRQARELEATIAQDMTRILEA
jgi:hypothetical protein